MTQWDSLKNIPLWFPSVLVAKKVLTEEEGEKIKNDRTDLSPKLWKERLGMSDQVKSQSWVIGPNQEPGRFLLRHLSLPSTEPAGQGVIMKPDTAPRLYMIVLFGKSIEGPPGLVHGGLTAALLDHCATLYAFNFGGDYLGWVTAHMGVDYKLPAPIERDYVIEVRLEDWVQEEKKKPAMKLKCRLFNSDGLVVAEASIRMVGLQSKL